jgi:methionyl aminopeptidase
MRIAGRIVANTLQELRYSMEPGMTTKEVDRIADQLIRGQGGDPAFPYVNHFPGCVCISVNNEVVHGIPGKRRLKEGDIVKLDVGAIYDGYHGDAAITVPIGEVSPEARRLVDVTEESLAVGIRAAGPEAHLYDIGAAIQDYVEPQGFRMVRQYVGHGIGRGLHEDPTVPHFRQSSRGIRLRPGMVFTIEPMVNAGTYDTRLLSDGWTVVTADDRLSAQFEHTIVITESGADVLTLPDKGEAWSIAFQTADVVQ